MLEREILLPFEPLIVDLGEQEMGQTVLRPQLEAVVHEIERGVPVARDGGIGERPMVIGVEAEGVDRNGRVQVVERPGGLLQVLGSVAAIYLSQTRLGAHPIGVVIRGVEFDGARKSLDGLVVGLGVVGRDPFVGDGPGGVDLDPRGSRGSAPEESERQDRRSRAGPHLPSSRINRRHSFPFTSISRGSSALSWDFSSSVSSSSS